MKQAWSRTVEIPEPRGGYFTHRDDCPEGSPDRPRWACDQGHWLAWEIPAGVYDRCPVVMHEADSDGRCVGTLSRPECCCRDGER